MMTRSMNADQNQPSLSKMTPTTQQLSTTSLDTAASTTAQEGSPLIKALPIKSPILSSQLIWPGENGLTGHEMRRAKFSQISSVVALPIGVRINRLLCVLKFCRPQISLIKSYFKKKN